MAGTHQEYIVLYRKLVQEKLLLGDGQGKLKQRDLEYIAEKIEEASRVRLSISTLKRIWRDDVTQEPHPATLDALVSILDFQDWQGYRKAHADSVNPQKSVQAEKRTSIRMPVALVIILGAGLSMAAFFVLEGFRKSSDQQGGKKGVVISGDVTFSADKTVTSGVPNTVIFRYDVTNVSADSFAIQQSWNPRDRQAIDPSNKYFSTIYYTPGFHFARLIANDSVIRFASIHIKTDGWMGIVKYDIADQEAFYLDAKRVKQKGILADGIEILKAANVDVSKVFLTRYYNIRDFEGVDSDHYDVETRFRCELLPGQVLNTGMVPCPEMQIMIVSEGSIHYVPLMSKGCASNLYLKIGDVYKNGKDHDLSALGCDPYSWQTLRIINSGKSVEVHLNGEIVHTLTYTTDFGKIKGIIYTFTGSGAVDYLRLADLNGKMVYEDEFEE